MYLYFWTENVLFHQISGKRFTSCCKNRTVMLVFYQLLIHVLKYIYILILAENSIYKIIKVMIRLIMKRRPGDPWTYLLQQELGGEVSANGILQQVFIWFHISPTQLSETMTQAWDQYSGWIPICRKPWRCKKKKMQRAPCHVWQAGSWPHATAAWDLIGWRMHSLNMCVQN